MIQVILSADGLFLSFVNIIFADILIGSFSHVLFALSLSPKYYTWQKQNHAWHFKAIFQLQPAQLWEKQEEADLARKKVPLLNMRK